MRKQALIIITLILFYTLILSGQRTVNRISNWTVQVTGSYAFTYHYGAPTQVLSCFEGCTVIEQRPRIGNNLQFVLNRKVNQQSSLNLGVGLATIHIYDKSSDDWYGGTFESNIKLKYYNLQLGYRYLPFRKNNLNYFLENKVLIESSVRAYGFKSITASYQLIAGFIFDWSQSLKLIASPFFKTAIINYSRFYDGYYPYSFGIDLGFLINLNKPI